MDNNTMITIVTVHSPLIQFSSSGSYYTSYAISLKSNDPCFNQPYSQIRRRYSEFLGLRRLLESHYPTLKPPVLPPRNYFHRFRDTFIEERKTGLEKFLEQVISTPVYLSDKSLHLFLQSSQSMDQISEECVGDIPAPQLMDWKSDLSSETSSMRSSSPSNNLFPENEIKDSDIERCFLYKETMHQTASALFPSNSIPRAIPSRRQRSLDSSPASSMSSSGASDCSSLERKRVSFNQNVTVAVVCNRLWNYDTKPIKTDT